MADISLANLDSSSDDPRQARQQIHDAVQRVNFLASTADAARGAALIGYSSTLAYAAGTVGAKLRDVVSVKDSPYGAVGDNVADDTSAFTAALATGKNVHVPPGTYRITSTLNIGYGQCLIGGGQYKTVIIYSGTGNGIYLGHASVMTYNSELRDLSIFCTSRAATVNGIMVENAVYFNIENISSFGSGSPNDPTPANQVLYGSGLYLTNNSIIGRISHVSCRLWAQGYYLKTLPSSQSAWTAALVFGGQGELGNCMRGIVVGDSTVGYYSGVGVVFRDLSIQGCYTTGMNINSGDGTIVDGCYFEGNANYDIAIGAPGGAPSPIGVKILNNNMNSGDIGVTPYGNFPYLQKIYVDRGIFTTIRDNNISIDTAISLISLSALADSSNISGNRLNSTIAENLRILDNGTGTITADNYPEKPRVKVGTFTRVLSAASGNVAYTGVGFRPTSIEFTASVDSAPEFCQGTVNGAGARCITSDAAGLKYNSSHAVRIIRDAAGREQAATLVSFDADGFTLAWTKTGTPPANDVIVNYMARR
jgi:hypothetical protein